ncbi:MAG: methyltransferase domain-containing protein [Burkholderiales bacterium]
MSSVIAVSHQHPSQGTPSPWLARWMAVLPAGARVLDLACGQGRHVSAALALGARVTGIDRDAEALARLPAGADRVQADLEGAPWPAALAPQAAWDAILVANYLFRPRLDLLPACLAPGGLLVYETFAQGNERYGRPRNPDFLLRPAELLALCERAGLVVLAYENGWLPRGSGALVQRVAAVRPPFDPERFPLEPGGRAGSGAGLG